MHGDVPGSCHSGGAPLRDRSERPPSEDLVRGIWKENPVLVQLMGLCPALAVSNTVANSLAMGLATAFVLTGSSLLVSLLKDRIPHAVRISGYVLIIATFVSIVDMVMQATVPEVHKALGAFVYLIVVNCMILGRQEAFASREPVGRSLLDAIGVSTGFLLALLLMGTMREVLGSGTLLGYPVLGSSFEPWVIMALPPGGFFTIAFLLFALNWGKSRKAEPAKVREWPHGLTVRKAA